MNYTMHTVHLLCSLLNLHLRGGERADGMRDAPPLNMMPWRMKDLKLKEFLKMEEAERSFRPSPVTVLPRSPVNETPRERCVPCAQRREGLLITRNGETGARALYKQTS